MKVLVRVLLCGVLATGLWAQRGGGGARGGGGGGFHGGGGGISRGGGGFSRGGAVGGGFRGGGFVGGGRGFGGGFRGYNGFGRFGYGRGFGIGLGFYGGYWPYWGGYGLWDPYWDYGYPYYPSYSSYYSYPAYNNYYYPTPQYAPVQPAPQQQARPDVREYRDEYGQSREITYLIAFKDGIIRATISYWVDGNTVHYVTRDRHEHTVPMDSVDRGFSERLNRDQRVPFHLP